MRTKVTILAAAIGLAVSGAFAAEQVYSVNAVGFVKVTIPPGFSLVANPLLSGNDTLAGLFPTPPNGTKFYKFDSATQSYRQIATFVVEDDGTGGWDKPTITLQPGEGGYIKVIGTQPYEVTFVGTVPQSTEGSPLRINLAAGFTIASSHVPQALPLSVPNDATAPSLNFPTADGDKIYFFRRSQQRPNGGYDTFTYFADDTAWAPGNPVPNVGEAFFVKKRTQAPWDRTFSVN